MTLLSISDLLLLITDLDLRLRLLVRYTEWNADNLLVCDFLASSSVFQRFKRSDFDRLYLHST